MNLAHAYTLVAAPKHLLHILLSTLPCVIFKPCFFCHIRNAHADDEAPKEGGELDDKAWRAMEREAEGVALGNGTENLQEVRQSLH
jgi:hypothetical protein